MPTTAMIRRLRPTLIHATRCPHAGAHDTIVGAVVQALAVLGGAGQESMHAEPAGLLLQRVEPGRGRGQAAGGGQLAQRVEGVAAYPLIAGAATGGAPAIGVLEPGDRQI